MSHPEPLRWGHQPTHHRGDDGAKLTRVWVLGWLHGSEPAFRIQPSPDCYMKKRWTPILMKLHSFGSLVFTTICYLIPLTCKLKPRPGSHSLCASFLCAWPILTAQELRESEGVNGPLPATSPSGLGRKGRAKLVNHGMEHGPQNTILGIATHSLNEREVDKATTAHIPAWSNHCLRCLSPLDTELLNTGTSLVYLHISTQHSA